MTHRAVDELYSCLRECANLTFNACHFGWDKYCLVRRRKAKTYDHFLPYAKDWQYLTIYFQYPTHMDRDSVVRIANRYGLKVRGLNACRGEIFATRPDRPWGPPSLLYNGYRVSFPGVKRPECGVDRPPPSSAEVKEWVELYLYSPRGPSRPVIGWTLSLPYRQTKPIHQTPGW